MAYIFIYLRGAGTITTADGKHELEEYLETNIYTWEPMVSKLLVKRCKNLQLRMYILLY